MLSQNPYQQPDSGSGPGQRRAASYGQACLHCFKSKSKCVRFSSGESCERCRRLKKQCSPADSLRKRNSQKASNSAATVAQLQDKVDNLTSLLHLLADNPDSSNALRETIKKQQQEEKETEKEGPKKEEEPEHSETLPFPVNWELSAGEAQRRLDDFRTRMLRFFAFMYLPYNLTANQLGGDRPLLFRAIMTVTSPSIQERRVRAKELKRLFAQISVEDNESSIDLLLSVLTYASWGYDHFIHKVTSPSRLTQMAMSLAYDLRLNKSPSKEAHRLPTEVPIPNQRRRTSSPLDDPSQQSLEKQRAVLGCFFLSSCMSSHFGQMDAMRWTPHMEKYVRAISKNKECQTDEMFALQVRLQLLVQRASDLRDQREVDRCQMTATSTMPCSTEPLLASFCLKALQGQLQEIELCIPPYLQHEEILIAHLHYASLRINETIYPAPDIEWRPSPLILTSTLEQLQCHFQSLEAIKNWLDNFFSMPLIAFIGIPFLFWSQLMQSLTVLFRLSVFRSPDWDCGAVRNTIDLLTVMDRIANILKQAGIETGETSPDDIYGLIYQTARGFRFLVEKEFMSVQQDQQVPMAMDQEIPPTAVPGWPRNESDSGGEMLSDEAQLLMMQFFNLHPMQYTGFF